MTAAVGSFYIFFFWDHTARNSQGVTPLAICINNGSDRYRLDSRLRPLGISLWFPSKNLMSGRSARAEIRWDIDHEYAFSILGDDHINPAGAVSLEKFLTAVRGAQHHGLNVFGLMRKILNTQFRTERKIMLLDGEIPAGSPACTVPLKDSPKIAQRSLAIQNYFYTESIDFYLVTKSPHSSSPSTEVCNQVMSCEFWGIQLDSCISESVRKFDLILW